MKNVNAQAIVDVALSWVGTPFHHRARIKGVGVDCANFLIGVFNEAGYAPNIELKPYPCDWHLHRGEELFLDQLKAYAEPSKTLRPLDIVMMRYGRCFSHGAIYLGRNEIIHSYVGVGVVKASLSDFTGHEQQYWRVKGL